MIKYLKKLWKKYFKGLGYSRTEAEVAAVKHTPTDLPILIVKPKPLHCNRHTRFKKSCAVCQKVIK